MRVADIDNICHIDQESYTNKIKQIPSDAKLSKFSSMKMRLAWLANTTPDILFKISQIAHWIEAMYENNIIKFFKSLYKDFKTRMTTKNTFAF